jgi:hypothetical protein
MESVCCNYLCGDECGFETYKLLGCRRNPHTVMKREGPLRWVCFEAFAVSNSIKYYYRANSCVRCLKQTNVSAVDSVTDNGGTQTLPKRRHKFISTIYSMWKASWHRPKTDLPNIFICYTPLSASKNEYQDIPGDKDGRCVRVKTLPPSKCRKSRKSGALTFRISRPVAGQLYLYFYFYTPLFYSIPKVKVSRYKSDVALAVPGSSRLSALWRW